MRTRRCPLAIIDRGWARRIGVSAFRYGVVWLAFFGVAVATTWPLSWHLSSHLPAGTDTLSHYWNDWWVQQALRSGRSPYYTDYLFYPYGVSLVYKNLAWLHILPWLVLQPLVGAATAYNLVLLAHLALCGLMAFILGEELTGDRGAAFLAGLIYQCWPYRMTQPSHPNLISTWGIPLFALLLRRTVRRRRIRDGVWCGLSLALVGYNRWQLLIPAAVIGSVYTLLSLPWRQRRAMLHTWRALTVAVTAAVIALGPPMLLFAHEWKHNPAQLILIEEELNMQTDVLAYFTPPAAHPLLGYFTAPAYEHYYTQRQGRRRVYSPYVGMVALSLAAIGLWTRRRQGLPWVGVAVALIALALGPVLRVNGYVYPSAPMPYALAAKLVVVRLLRFPDRFNMSLALPLAVLAAYGATHLRKARRPLVPTALLEALIVFEYLIVPLPLQAAQVSTWYEELAAEDDGTALLNIPNPLLARRATHEARLQGLCAPL